MTVEEYFGIEISGKEAGRMETIGDLHRFVASDVNRAVVREIKTMLVEQTGVDPAEIRMRDRRAGLQSDQKSKPV